MITFKASEQQVLWTIDTATAAAAASGECADLLSGVVHTSIIYNLPSVSLYLDKEPSARLASILGVTDYAYPCAKGDYTQERSGCRD